MTTSGLEPWAAGLAARNAGDELMYKLLYVYLIMRNLNVRPSRTYPFAHNHNGPGPISHDLRYVPYICSFIYHHRLT